MKVLQKLYEKLVLDFPALTLLLVSVITIFFAIHTPDFRLDASSESLALENDSAVKYYRSIKARYGSDDYLVVTYTPKTGALFSAKILDDLQTLRIELAALERVQAVTSILDVPLIGSPPVTLEELSENVRTLMNPDTDKGLAEEELITSPFYKQLLMSEDGETTALFVNFSADEKLEALLTARDDLREKALDSDLTRAERRQLKEVEKTYADYNAGFQKQWDRDIAAVRTILKQHKNTADIYLGGVPMIIADSIAFISKDLRIFGGGILAFLVVLLSVIFRRLQWVLLPMAVCVCVGVCVIGFLGLVDWPVTIVSSNFISLLLIFTLSFCVHQIVRYRECAAENPKADQRALVGEMVRTISVPCAYMVFTTIVAFGSLVISDIRPIIDFGWMMAIGLAISFVIAFTLFPAALMFLKPEQKVTSDDMTQKITMFFVHLIQRQGKIILAGFFTLLVLSIWGVSQLYVQNRFIDYYKKDTAIYQGMEVIDRKLGGTTPLDVIIDAPPSFIQYQREEKALLEEDGWGAPDDGCPILDGYWFCENGIKDAAQLHEYLESLPETGKVLSFYTTAQLLQNLKNAKPVDRFYLGVLYNSLPEDVKDFLFTPYISEDGNQLRFSIRVFESMEGVDRQALLDKIQTHLTSELNLAEEQVHMTGMVVLYNNVLQTLFRSQIVTVWVVFVTMFLVFIALFRNIKVAAVAIIPNITVTLMVLGAMGWMNIPLDIMTITIAAIAFGTADDNTIHYVHRMMKEYKTHGHYWQAVERAHTTIGRAVYYTGITVVLGFSILALSNFVPTIYFGLLVGFSMLAALLANLALLPLLMVLFKPLGKERAA
jgi:predicted RND superfamily exporter protein